MAHAALQALVSALVLILSSSAHAAPLQADTPASGADAGVTATGALGQPTSRGSRTVDLLIELQPRSAGVEFNNDRVRPSTDRGLRPVATPQPQQTPAAEAEAAPVQAGLFGSGAVPQTQARKGSESDWQRTNSGSAGRSEPPSSDGPRRNESASGTPLPFWLLLPRELIAYLRENRNMVIGLAIGLLGLMWGGSIVAGRMRR
jgi:hypothetical protein